MKTRVFERSSGGLVLKFQKEKSKPFFEKLKINSPHQTKILMVQVKNLLGKIRWTFPKGHVEAGETIEQAALREVLEETGWHCKRVRTKKPRFETVRYLFKRGTQTVNKEVIWFLMQPVSKKGKMDPEEIRKAGWFTLPDCKRKVRYPSDKKLIEKIIRLTQ